MAISIYSYSRLNTELEQFYVSNIKTHIPEPTKNDYQIGYIKRFFVQKANDTNATIYEIDSETYLTLATNPFYSTTTLDWRIIGTTQQVNDSNSKSIKLASTNIVNLKLYLPNLLQFYKY